MGWALELSGLVLYMNTILTGSNCFQIRPYHYPNCPCRYLNYVYPTLHYFKSSLLNRFFSMSGHPNLISLLANANSLSLTSLKNDINGDAQEDIDGLPESFCLLSSSWNC